MRVVVTGSDGFLGWHACVHLHAMNCEARFKGKPEPIELIRLNRKGLNNPGVLAGALAGADAILHFAGVNRGTDSEIETGNPAIAGLLAKGTAKSGSSPHIVYANSVHAQQDTPYGRSKKHAGEILAGCSPRFTDLVLPHIFGESARPDYNNVTATLVQYLYRGVSPLLAPDARVTLLHAGAAVGTAIGSVLRGQFGRISPRGRSLSVNELWDRLSGFHRRYSENTFPDLSDPFDLALFNTYLAGRPVAQASALKLHSDARGTLFETAKSKGGGQVFLSWTKPGARRGDHFHLGKLERFVVLQGSARIRLRKVFSSCVHSIDVNGETPMTIDIPTLHSHSIENTGTQPLLTLFWAHEAFDPAAPDTYSDPVLRETDETTQGHDDTWNPTGDRSSVACHGAA